MSHFEDIPTIDRSTLERYATCPMQARLCAEVVRSTGPEAAVGTEVHNAFARMIGMYIEEQGMLGDREIVERTTNELLASRPDVQPDVMEAARRSLREFGKLIGEQKWWKDPESGKVRCTILRHDGGQGKYSGQLSYDHGGVIVTGEVDLLLQGRAVEEVSLTDYKTGHYYWTADAVGESFQFQCYAALIFENYQEVERVWVSVWNTRTNSRTYRVAFTREYDLPAIKARIGMALAAWFANKSRPIESVEAWPLRDKCAKCPALLACRAADSDISDPPKLVARLQWLNEQSKAITSILSERVKATGEDVVGDGVAFGWISKPAGKSKPRAALYALAGDSDDE